ncbi:VOC family protein [Rhizobium leguminosarum]|uniref:VOC family protein n=1 Tax=Rhizobium leguminosarum TaxID=384 RepID=UPI003F9DE071
MNRDINRREALILSGAAALAAATLPTAAKAADFVPPAKRTDSIFADMRGHHIAVRTPNLEEAKAFYIDKLEFRVIAEWDYADEKLAYIAPPTDDHFYIEILGGGDPQPQEVRPYTDLGDSLKYRGYHHFCLNVNSVDETVEKLRGRDVKIITEPFVLPAISRKLAFFSDPFGNLIELAEVLA